MYFPTKMYSMEDFICKELLLLYEKSGSVSVFWIVLELLLVESDFSGICNSSKNYNPDQLLKNILNSFKFLFLNLVSVLCLKFHVNRRFYCTFQPLWERLYICWFSNLLLNGEGTFCYQITSTYIYA